MNDAVLNEEYQTWLTLEPGEDYVIAGTIKAHKEFQGTKETILTRVKVEE